MQADTCGYCGVADALGRHAGDCQYALDTGLPRLADGEEPIDSDEAYEDEPTEAVGEFPPGPRIRAPEPHKLWLAYRDARNGGIVEFDALVFESEIEALRYAVDNSYRVAPLKLGRSIREQTDG